MLPQQRDERVQGVRGVPYGQNRMPLRAQRYTSPFFWSEPYLEQFYCLADALVSSDCHDVFVSLTRFINVRAGLRLCA